MNTKELPEPVLPGSRADALPPHLLPGSSSSQGARISTKETAELSLVIRDESPPLLFSLPPDLRANSGPASCQTLVDAFILS